MGLYSTFRRSGVFLLTFVVMAFSAPYATGLVLCICHDGHISVETRCNPNDCCPAVLCDSETPVVPAFSPVPSGHDCLDLVIESTTPGARVARQDSGLAQGQPKVRALPVIFRINPDLAVRRVPVEDRATSVPALLPLDRTVVLTI